ncbi:UDP-N-acetylmuramoyl-L-alanine--D-glutamate ligase [Facilibium subflavum]|uniref:UDP-N-acetylmuramoyl-L-alanine--D-glutamate ligase n=1 Tax=Facilibium subflavum TaxID=2219058 RepID=UPI000E6552D6|nr:UDP-N-acetylmuramoyl-L-alanine--D-glutamate ligase [Facilibium subflavum]
MRKVATDKLKSYYYQGRLIRKVIVVGLGISGRSVVDFFEKYQVEIEVFDQSQTIPMRRCYQYFDEVRLDEYDLIIVSPGIPVNQSPFNKLDQHWDKVVGDVEIFAMEVLKNPYQKIVAISGSNGKSTAVTLLHYVLNKSGINAALGGNIGVPALSLLDKAVDVYVLELSSFQIDLLKHAKFTVACVLNISDDHLDRYERFADYKASKYKLFLHAEYQVANAYDCWAETSMNLQYFNAPLAYIDANHHLVYKGQCVLSANTLLLQGYHNLENILALLYIIDSLSLSVEGLLPYFKDFKGLPHRCQEVGVINGVRFVNDSKATNIGAVIASVKSLSVSGNILLLLGGMAKGADFCLLKDVVKHYVKKVFIYGQDRFLIEKALKCQVNYQVTESLTQAFDSAVSYSVLGDTVLLAPGCASFDAFSSFAERGKFFESLVNKLKGG